MNFNLVQQTFTTSSYPNRGLCFINGDGVYLTTDTGDRYLDLISGSFGVTILGHSNEFIRKKLHHQIDRLVTLHSSFSTDIGAVASKNIVHTVRSQGFSDITKVFWSNSGAEAVEAAMKFATLATGKFRFISAKNSYHGKTLGALSLNNSGDGKYKKPFQKIIIQSDNVSFGDITDLERMISKEHAALVLEPIQGEGGVVVPPKDYLSQAAKLCRAKGILLIVDEIQTGLGRTGNFLGLSHFISGKFGPDILCLGKGLAGGIPVGATLISRKINAKIIKGIHTSTFGGNPLAMSGVEATLQYFQKHEKFFQEVQEKGRYFIEKLDNLRHENKHVINSVHGLGLMIGVELTVDPLIVLKGLQKKKIIAAPTNGNRIRFLPPLIITKKQIDDVIKSLGEVIAEIKG